MSTLPKSHVIHYQPLSCLQLTRHTISDLNPRRITKPGTPSAHKEYAMISMTATTFCHNASLKPKQRINALTFHKHSNVYIWNYSSGAAQYKLTSSYQCTALTIKALSTLHHKWYYPIKTHGSVSRQVLKKTRIITVSKRDHNVCILTETIGLLFSLRLVYDSTEWKCCHTKCIYCPNGKKAVKYSPCRYMGHTTDEKLSLRIWKQLLYKYFHTAAFNDI